MTGLYLGLVRLVHRRKARIAASWALAPEFIPGDADFCQAVAETDAVISVSKCTVQQFRTMYGWRGDVHVVPYHNELFFAEPLPLPPGPPWRIGYLGRLEVRQKNLEQLLQAFAGLASVRTDVELHFYGGGSGQPALQQQARALGIHDRVFFHGRYDHRQELRRILAACHLFAYPSRFEGGPCFSLLELMQAGRYCVASAVGGIPDLYEGRPNIDAFVTPGDAAKLRAALIDAVARVATGAVDAQEIHFH